MFDRTLVESSSTAMLHRKHWLVALVAGAAAALVARFSLPSVLPATGLWRWTGFAVAVGILAACSALMANFAYADAKRAGLDPGVWAVIVGLLSGVGFVAYLIRSAAKTGQWRRATVPLAYVLEVGLVGLAVLVPLLYPVALPKVWTGIVCPPAPAAVASGSTSRTEKTPRRAGAGDFPNLPVLVPKGIPKSVDEPSPPIPASFAGVGRIPGGVPGGAQGNAWDGVLNGLGPAPPPPPAPKVAKSRRIRVGGQVEAARLIHQVKPEYPELARRARIEGTARLEAVISPEGTIRDLKVLSGHPVLVKAAMQAVARWRYQPTLLNGEPVEVLTEIDVNFTLSE